VNSLTLAIGARASLRNVSVDAVACETMSALRGIHDPAAGFASH
jgi:hypothetical protein